MLVHPKNLPILVEQVLFNRFSNTRNTSNMAALEVLTQKDCYLPYLTSSETCPTSPPARTASPSPATPSHEIVRELEQKHYPECYRIAKQAEASELTPQFLELRHYEIMSANQKVYFGPNIPSAYIDIQLLRTLITNGPLKSFCYHRLSNLMLRRINLERRYARGLHCRRLAQLLQGEEYSSPARPRL